MSIDYIIFQLINNFAGRWAALDWLGIFAASYLQYIVVAGLLIFWFLGKSKEERAKNLSLVGGTLGAVVLSRLVFTEFIRWFWFRPRPFVDHTVNLLITHANTGSFPSGHAAFFFALAMTVYIFEKKMYPKPFDFAQSRFHQGVGLWLFSAAILISLARVFVGIHYPSDILVGVLVGLFSGWLVIKIYVKIASIKNIL